MHIASGMTEATRWIKSLARGSIQKIMPEIRNETMHIEVEREHTSAATTILTPLDIATT